MEYFHGCNYPWSTDGRTIYYGMDFGANVWGSHLGVSTRREAVARDFSDMARLGFTVARWFVFCDGRAGIVYDSDGIPAAIDPHFFPDMDAALEIARDAGIRLDLVLLDHHWMFSGLRDAVVDPITGERLERRLPHGRAHVLLSSSGRDALVERVLVPLVTRYGRSGERRDLADQILAFELMNEPDFVIGEWRRDRSSRVPHPVPFEVFAELAGRLSRAVHEQSPALVTLGGARLRNLRAWDDAALGLDVLQVHSYPDTRRLFAEADIFGTPVWSLGVSRAVILGEFPGNAPEQHPKGASPPDTTLYDYLEFAVSNGYAGAWPWSFSGTDPYGRLPVEPLRRFAVKYPDLVNPRSLTDE
jgi:hypothetical protein